MTRFELATSRPPAVRATKLRHIPIKFIVKRPYSHEMREFPRVRARWVFSTVPTGNYVLNSQYMIVRKSYTSYDKGVLLLYTGELCDENTVKLSKCLYKNINYRDHKLCNDTTKEKDSCKNNHDPPYTLHRCHATTYSIRCKIIKNT